MKHYKSYKLTIFAIIIMLGVYSVYEIGCSDARNTFIHMNRGTNPNPYLESIADNQMYKVKFSNQLRVHKFTVQDNKGVRLFDIEPFISVDDNTDWSELTPDSFICAAPYTESPFDNNSARVVDVVVSMLNLDVEHYQRLGYSVFDMIHQIIPYEYSQKIFYPLLNEMFDAGIYVRTSSPNSIIASIRLNKLGRIDRIFLYNGCFVEIGNTYDENRSGIDLFQMPIDSINKEKLVAEYTDRLDRESVSSHALQAEELAESHINEIKNALVNDEFEILYAMPKQGFDLHHADIYDSASFPSWIWKLKSWLYFILFLVGACFIYDWKRNKYFERMALCLEYIRTHYTQAARIENLPNELVSKPSEELLNKLSKGENFWVERENEIHRNIENRKCFDALEKAYPKGVELFKQSHEGKTSFFTIDMLLKHSEEIKSYDRNYKKSLLQDEWEKEQAAFTQECRGNHAALSGFGYYFYDLPFQKFNYRGESKRGKYRVWQFFYDSYCTDTTLDYTHHKRVIQNYNNIDNFKQGKYNYPHKITQSIYDFIKKLGDNVQVITIGKYFEGNVSITTLALDLHMMGIKSIDLTDVNKLTSNRLVILDGVTSHQDFERRCSVIMDKFRDDKPCITYISLHKEFSNEEMSDIIEKKKAVLKTEKEKEIQKTRIEQDVDNAHMALLNNNVEEAIQKISELKRAKDNEKDIELNQLIENKIQQLETTYNEGVVDNLQIVHVDYNMQRSNAEWEAYPVVKYPTYGNIVFPYRRRSVARRGYMEDQFESYLKNYFANQRLQVLGDCAILPVDNHRPYEPDIAIIAIDRPSIRIDIEIDEPYAAITNKPIHHIGCGDDFRDLNLTNIGWIVIRFSEYQVYSDMQGCATYISKVIAGILSQNTLDRNLGRVVSTYKRWTKIEAEVMAAERVRQAYLHHDFEQSDSEQLTMPDITQVEKERTCAREIKPLLFSNNNAEYTAKSLTNEFNRDKGIQFLPEEHIYLFKGHQKLVPVSTVISYFFKPFVSLYHSERVARRRGVPQGKVMEEWDAKGLRSREIGTYLHKQIENFFDGKKFQDETYFTYKGKYIHENEQVSLLFEHLAFDDFVNDHKFKPYRIEWAIYDEDLGIAGTIDMMQKDGDSFNIYDWKRSGRILDFFGNPIIANDFGDRGIRGLEGINDTPYWHYCLQQNLYKFLLEKNYGIKVGHMFLVVFEEGNRQYRKVEVPVMDAILQVILQECSNGNVRHYYNELLN